MKATNSSYIEKLETRVDRLLENNIKRSEFDTMFLYELLKEVKSLTTNKESSKTDSNTAGNIIVSGGTFTD